jgi:putative MATE family efflux protein
MRIFPHAGKDDPSMLFSGEDLRRLIVPLVLEQALMATISVANTMMVASVGETAVSAVSLVETINILLVNIFAAMTTGGAVVTAQYLGRREQENAGLAARQLLYTVLLVSLGIAALSLIFHNALLNAIFPGVEPIVMEYSRVYFLITALSFPFLSIYDSSAALLRTIGNSKTALKTSLLMNILNIGGNALLILVFRLGVEGAAIATLFARIVGAIVMVAALKKPHPLLRVPSLRRWQWDRDMVRRILHIGVPSGLENGMFQAGKILIQSLVASLGTVSITANAVAGNLATFECIPGSAICLAILIVAGRCVGAREYGQARYYVRRLMGICVLSLFALAGFMLLFRFFFIGSYNLSQETSVLVMQLFLLHSAFCVIFWPLSFALPNALRAAGDARFSMIFSGFSMLVFRIAFSYLLVLQFHMGVMGVWWAMIIDWIARSVAFYLRYRSNKWEKKAFL